MPVHCLVNGSEHTIAIELDRVRSIPSLRSELSEAYAEVTGTELAPYSIVVKYEDEAERRCLLDSDHLLRQGLLVHTSRALYLTARPLRAVAKGRGR